MARTILPSTARTYARFSQKKIARGRRRALKEALNLLTSEDDWDDAEMWRHVSPRLSRLRSEECERISVRRGSDKLGPLRRWTKHHQKSSQNDEEALEKISKILKPSQNLIMKHAVDHARWWLRLKEDQFKWWRLSAMERTSPTVSSEQFKAILSYLYEHDHAKLNKALKQGEGAIRCTEKDQCITSRCETRMLHEVWDRQLKKWCSYSLKRQKLWSQRGEEPLVLERKIVREWSDHNIQICKKRPIIQNQEDVERVARMIGPVWWRQMSPAVPQLMQLAFKHDLISVETFQTLREKW